MKSQTPRHGTSRRSAATSEDFNCITEDFNCTTTLGTGSRDCPPRGAARTGCRLCNPPPEPPCSRVTKPRAERRCLPAAAALAPGPRRPGRPPVPPVPRPPRRHCPRFRAREPPPLPGSFARPPRRPRAGVPQAWPGSPAPAAGGRRYRGRAAPLQGPPAAATPDAAAFGAGERGAGARARRRPHREGLVVQAPHREAVVPRVHGPRQHLVQVHGERTPLARRPQPLGRPSSRGRQKRRRRRRRHIARGGAEPGGRGAETQRPLPPASPAARARSRESALRRRRRLRPPAPSCCPPPGPAGGRGAARQGRAGPAWALSQGTPESCWRSLGRAVGSRSSMANFTLLLKQPWEMLLRPGGEGRDVAGPRGWAEGGGPKTCQGCCSARWRGHRSGWPLERQ